MPTLQVVSETVLHAILMAAALFVAGCALSSSSDQAAPAIATTANTTTETVTAKSVHRSPAQDRASKVALLLPLSAAGPTGAIAKGMKQAAELALFDGGSATVQLIVKDDLGTPEGAIAAAEDAIKEGVELIAGPLFSSSVKVVAPLAQRANIPVLAFSNDAQVAGNGVYLISFLVTQDIDRVVAYCVGQGRKRFAALIADDAYGQLTGAAFRQAVSSHGGSIKVFETYPAQAGNTVLEPARKLVEGMKRADEDGEPVEALFTPGSADSLSNLGPLLTYAGLDSNRTKLIGTGAWDQAGRGRETAFIGGWFAAPEPRGWQEFSEKFGRIYGAAPPRIATLAYDAVTLVVQLSSNERGRRYTAATLTQSSGFHGADGRVRLKSNGASQRSLAILEVQKLGVTIVDKAPAEFDPD